ncbi:FAD-dependent oxidoreductase [Mucilaginibacter paludis]|uniref:Flavin-dependent monooxygenase n=1 Tax=Mucilaginibacter paludis DSM 18603 TaxID=714943 RepID=H1Y6E6_9SPHI|nr:NAD(P)/FAD-dependent oxidoreductase [Mucilaginibacter paludis]EHQ24894.1 FAD dependent oxidoreductase [Mucilaginibacter paludis DSM 18603]
MKTSKAINLLQNKQVAIIGGGPGGLTLARLLQLKGVNVKVYERDFNATARVQGATLDLHFGSGLKAIEAAGLMETFKATYRPGNEKGRVVDKNANIIYDEHNKEAIKDFDSSSYRPEIDRGPLRDMLLNSLHDDTVVWDSQLKSLSRDGHGWKLKFKNGSTATADLVIGADGANSIVRPLVIPVKPLYSGVLIVQGNVENGKTAAPRIHHLLKDGKIYAYGDGMFLHISSKGDGSIDFYISLKKDEHWLKTSGIDFADRTQVHTWFKNEFLEWDSIWLELIENTELPLLLRPQYYIPSGQTWQAQPNITLLGDAAHIMPPSGEGVNLAMLDALELSECITSESYDDLRSAVAAYEEPMRARAVQELRDSLEMAEWMHSENALSLMVELLDQNQ